MKPAPPRTKLAAVSFGVVIGTLWVLAIRGCVQ